LTIALNVVLVVRLPKGFFPEQDTGVVFGGVTGPEDASFQAMDASMRTIVDTVRRDPAIAHVNAFTQSANRGNVFAALIPIEDRDVDARGVIARLRRELDRLPVASVFLQAAQDLRVGGRIGNALYQYTIQSDSTAELAKWGPILLARMRRLPGFTDVNSDQH